MSLVNATFNVPISGDTTDHCGVKVKILIFSLRHTMTLLAIVLGNKTRNEFWDIFRAIQMQIDIWNILRYYSNSSLKYLELMFFQLGEKIPERVGLSIYFFEPVDHDFLQLQWKNNNLMPRLIIKESGGNKAKWHDWTPLVGWKHGAIELLP